MAMSAGPSDDGAPMSDINTTPLVDVMLVLLIIFLITVPVVIQTVPVKLPSVRYEATTTKPENVALSIRAASNGACEVYWGQTKVTGQELLDRSVAKLKREIDKQGGPSAPGLELPEVHIRGDINTPYRCIGGAMVTVQRAGFQRVGFISEPPPGGNERL
ncbi:ExbD/TolR family protein [Sphingomonas montanisoli]|uniref:Biopolymer transporter ExbD n=1 Tax=Sphingomonas montanisoli TaxID=2606412 RepID=A0A5D9C8R5_9SPHN|nr:biopolymer transporter ExbD [Sphingomonas montanisoli]TZG27766.1 biopolymer transporter ExbD [Sphingomonas montanisoli]